MVFCQRVERLMLCLKDEHRCLVLENIHRYLVLYTVKWGRRSSWENDKDGAD